MSKRKPWKVDRQRKKELVCLCREYDRMKAEGREDLAGIIRKAAHLAEPTIADYLLVGLTKGRAGYLLIMDGMPCGIDYYYERRKKMLNCLDQLLEGELPKLQAGDKPKP